MKVLFNNIWRVIERCRLLKKKVRFKGWAHFNQNTVFGGNNIIGKKSSVSDSIIGRFTYIGGNDQFDNVEIGAFCSIGANISVITSTHPTKGFVSTHPAFFSKAGQAVTSFVKENLFDEHLRVNGKNLIIGNDVWVGHKVTFIGGIKVGDGAIIGTGAVVTKDVPPYAIVGGVPAKIIRFRFSNEVIHDLEEFKWWEKDEEWLITHHDIFCSIDSFINEIKGQ